MQLPPNKTIEEVLAAIDKSTAILAPRFVFGYYDMEDINQECFLYVVELFSKGKYDPERPLENYVFCHMRNRLINLLRDKLHRNDPPCKPCHNGEPCGGRGNFCQRYLVWKKRNLAKANLVRPLDLEHVADEHEERTRTRSCVAEDVINSELFMKIDEHLPVDLRQPFLQMLAGVSVLKAQRDEVAEAVRKILGEDSNG